MKHGNCIYHHIKRGDEMSPDIFETIVHDHLEQLRSDGATARALQESGQGSGDGFRLRLARFLHALAERFE